eukprot:3417468-Rhodomonas_salina.3
MPSTDAAYQRPKLHHLLVLRLLVCILPRSAPRTAIACAVRYPAVTSRFRGSNCLSRRERFCGRRRRRPSGIRLCACQHISCADARHGATRLYSKSTLYAFRVISSPSLRARCPQLTAHMGLPGGRRAQPGASVLGQSNPS